MKKIGLAILLWFIIAPLKAQNKQVETQIDQLLQKYKSVGLAVAVVKNKELVYQHSFGLKSIEKNEPLGNDDIFRIASISKSFAATAIMQLVEQGKMSLDDDLSQLIGFKVRNPKFPDDIITLRMALSHRSSLNDREGYFTLNSLNPATNTNWANCYSNNKPGSTYAYCNLNFNLLGAVVERYSGERYDVYIKQHLLKPLNLYGGLCVDSLDAKRFVSLYEYNKTTDQFVLSESAYSPRSEEFKNYQLGYSAPILSPTGGMKISAADLAKYMTMHMYYGKSGKKRIISKKSSKLMQTPNGTPDNYGFALLQTEQLIPGVTMVGHTGSAYGLSSAMFFNPKEKYGFVAITNGTSSPYNKVSVNLITECITILYQNFIKQ